MRTWSKSSCIMTGWWWCVCLSYRDINYLVIFCRFVASAWENMWTMMSWGSCHVPIFSTKIVLISGWGSMHYVLFARVRWVAAFRVHSLGQVPARDGVKIEREMVWWATCSNLIHVCIYKYWLLGGSIYPYELLWKELLEMAWRDTIQLEYIHIDYGSKSIWTELNNFWIGRWFHPFDSCHYPPHSFLPFLHPIWNWVRYRLLWRGPAMW